MRSLLSVMMVLPSALTAGQDDRPIFSAGIVLQKPSEMTLIRGQTAYLRLRVLRDNVQGDLEVEFAGFPPGVRVVNVRRRIIIDEAAYILQADPQAALVRRQQATVTVRTADGRFVASEVLWISVKEQE